MAAPRISGLDLDHVLEATRAQWEEMRGERLFLTGGTGFFGCWLLETFVHANRSLKLNAQAVVLTRRPDAFRAKMPHVTEDSSVTLHQGDVRDFAYPQGTFVFVIHAATEASAKQAAEAPLEMLSTILAGTERTLEFASAHGTRKFLLTSSGAVYGKQPDDVTHVPETYQGAPDPLQAGSVYGEGKRASELMCALYGPALECKIARCWAFSGPHLPLNAHFAIGNFVADVLAGRPIRIEGDGTARRSYLYAADLAIWLWTILFSGPALMPLHVGSARDLSILELARTVAASLGAAPEIHVAKQAIAGAPVSRYVPSVRRAEDILGLRETVTLEEGIRQMAAWHRAAQIQ